MAEPVSVMLFGGGLTSIVIPFLRARFRQAKRGLDILVALLGLVITAPVLALSGLAVKLTSRGPLLIRQERVGRGGRIFQMLKLRTMVDDAEAETGPVWATEDDRRVTAVGRFLRVTHLDELPQLVNVLKGDMSIVGPRPERPAFVRELEQDIPAYRQRLKVRPGITGLAQIRQDADRCVEDVKRKLRYDLIYIDRMCWLLEFSILMLTVPRLLGLRVGERHPRQSERRRGGAHKDPSVGYAQGKR